MKKNSFVYGAIILLGASLFNKIIGFIYQILMIRLIKPEGVGLFNMIFPVYIMALVLAGLGIPLAISKLVAEEIALNHYHRAYKIFGISLSILIFTGTIATSVLYFSAPLLIKYYFPNPDVYYCFLALIPSVFFVSICSAFRGFFQGLQQMMPTAITQILEQIVRVTLGLTIAYFLLPRGINYAAIGISIGVLCGEITGLFSMLFIFFRYPRKKTSAHESIFKTSNVLKRIFSLGIPVTLTRFVSTAFMSIEAIMIPLRLHAGGASLQQATSTFGQLTGISYTLLMTPGMLTTALATALIPAVSESIAQRNFLAVQSRTEEAIRITILAGFPCIVFFLFLPKELCQLLFGYSEAASSLAILALGGLFLYYFQTTTAILQGIGKAIRPFHNLLIASSVKIIILYFLTAKPALGICGAAIAITVQNILMAFLNFLDLRKTIGFHFQFVKLFFKPLIAATIMSFSIILIKGYFLNNLTTLSMTTFGSILMGSLMYLMAIWHIGCITPQDILRVKKIIKRILPFT